MLGPAPFASSMSIASIASPEWVALEVAGSLDFLCGDLRSPLVSDCWDSCPPLVFAEGVDLRLAPSSVDRLEDGPSLPFWARRIFSSSPFISGAISESVLLVSLSLASSSASFAILALWRSTSTWCSRRRSSLLLEKFSALLFLSASPSTILSRIACIPPTEADDDDSAFATGRLSCDATRGFSTCAYPTPSLLPDEPDGPACAGDGASDSLGSDSRGAALRLFFLTHGLCGQRLCL